MAAHENPSVSKRRPLPAEPKTSDSDEYLSVVQLAQRIPYKPKTIRNLIWRGVFVEGVHFTRPMGRPIFIWSRVQQLLREGAHERTRQSRAEDT